MTTIKAHYDGKTFVPDQPVSFPPNQPVTLHIDSTSPNGARPSPQELLKKLQELERMAITSNAPDADFSRDSIYPGNLL